MQTNACFKLEIKNILLTDEAKKVTQAAIIEWRIPERMITEEGITKGDCTPDSFDIGSKKLLMSPAGG